jgi:membrane carboxypeptidase/penicillin-binding protein
MEECNFIAEEQLQEALAESLRVTPTPLNAGNAPYFLEMVRLALEEEFTDEQIYTEGLVVRTTLDLPLQQEVDRIVENQLVRLEDRIQMSKTRARYLQSRDQGQAVPVEYLQAAALVLDAETGAIRALTGGRSYEESEFNRVTSAHRQPGSAFKPFIYLAAIQKGFYPSYTVLDEPVSFKQVHTRELWSPQNYDREYHGLVTLREALQRSLNIPTIKLQEEIGVEAVIDAARRTGLRDPIPSVRSIALGTAEVTLLDLTTAYAVFANNGIRVEPRFLERVTDRRGNTLKEYRSERREVLPPGPVGVLNSMLESVVNNGTGAGSRAAGFSLPAAGKTGTTDDYSDAWFVGYTPNTVAGVWVGYDQPRTIGRGMSGTQAALPIWTEIMLTATQDAEPRPFEVPEQIVSRPICVETGLPASPACPVTRPEVFLEGHVPGETCYLHRSGSDRRLRERWQNAKEKGKPTRKV